jgi:hypothetical protein
MDFSFDISKLDHRQGNHNDHQNDRLGGGTAQI